MSLETIRVLFIEDDAGYARLIRDALYEATALGWELPQFALTWVNTLAAALAYLDAGGVDVVLSDLDLPDSQAGDTFARLHAHAPGSPIVVLTGRDDEALARDTVHAGAADYLFKRELRGSLLAHALLYAIERQRNMVGLQAARTAELEHANAHLRQEVAERARAEENHRRALAEALQATQALRESMEKYRQLVEDINDVIYSLDGEGIITYISPAIKTVIGYTAEEVIGRHFSAFIDEQDRPHIMEQFEQVLAGNLRPDEYRILMKSGDVRWARSFSRPFLQEGEFDGARGVLTDITEHKRAELALRESEDELAAIYDGAPLIILLLDKERRVHKINRTALEMLDRTLDETIGLRGGEVLGCIHALDNPQGCGFGVHCPSCVVRHTVLDTLETGERHSCIEAPMMLNTAGGPVTVWLLISTTPMNVSGEERVLVCMEDMTARKQTEMALEKTIAELARSNADLEQFAFIISHDLREPLRAVTSYLQLLQKRYAGQLDEKAERFIAYAVGGAGRMHELINGLLAYSRVGTRAEPFTPVDCGLILDNALADLKVFIEERRAVVTRDPLPTVVADAVQLGQVFRNLIDNAIKFCREEPPRVHVSARRESDVWVFAVHDNGIGIDPTQSKRIFDVFQRLHTLEEYPGAGIGLPICKRIVERHGGRIWVHASSPDQGSTFCFTIPLQEETGL